MCGPPDAPSSNIGRSPFSTIVGDMLDSGRLPGAIALAADWISPYALGFPGSVVKSSI